MLQGPLWPELTFSLVLTAAKIPASALAGKWFSSFVRRAGHYLDFIQRWEAPCKTANARDGALDRFALGRLYTLGAPLVTTGSCPCMGAPLTGRIGQVNEKKHFF